MLSEHLCKNELDVALRTLGLFDALTGIRPEAKIMDISWQDLVHSSIMTESEVECVDGWMVQGKQASCSP